MSVKEAGNLAYDRDQYRQHSQAATSQATDFPASQRRKSEVSIDMPGLSLPLQKKKKRIIEISHYI